MIALTLLAILCGCATTSTYRPTEEDARTTAGQIPDQSEAEKLIFETVKSKLKDPDSIKQFRVSIGPIFVNKDVWVGLLNGSTRRVIGWLYCAEYNAKNSHGGYGGVENMALLLRNQNGLVVVDTDRKCT
jgi:hypothetical protein